VSDPVCHVSCQFLNPAGSFLRKLAVRQCCRCNQVVPRLQRRDHVLETEHAREADQKISSTITFWMSKGRGGYESNVCAFDPLLAV
jgi:hypothetical protein